MFTPGRIYAKTGHQSELALGKKPRLRQSATPELALTSVLLSLASVPALIATQAQAPTTANGCTVTPHTATVIGQDLTGHKMLQTVRHETIKNSIGNVR